MRRPLIFNSKALINDPRPWRNRYDGSRWANPGIDAGQHTPGAGVLDHLPRTEFANNPNPILESFRDDWGNRNLIPSFFDGWLMPWAGVNEPGSLAGDHQQHAHRVITKLAAFVGAGTPAKHGEKSMSETIDTKYDPDKVHAVILDEDGYVIEPDDVRSWASDPDLGDNPAQAMLVTGSAVPRSTSHGASGYHRAPGSYKTLDVLAGIDVSGFEPDDVLSMMENHIELAMAQVRALPDLKTVANTVKEQFRAAGWVVPPSVCLSSAEAVLALFAAKAAN